MRETAAGTAPPCHPPYKRDGGLVGSRVTLRDTWGRRQAGAVKLVRSAGWVRAGSCAPAAKKLRGPSARAQARRISIPVSLNG